MEEIKQLIELVANLPTLAVWVLAGYLLYKLVIVGSVYGLIRFIVDKVYNAYISPRPTKPIEGSEFKCIDQKVASKLIFQLNRLIPNGLTYMHDSDVNDLRDALDAYFKVKHKS